MLFYTGKLKYHQWKKKRLVKEKGGKKGNDRKLEVLIKILLIITILKRTVLLLSTLP